MGTRQKNVLSCPGTCPHTLVRAYLCQHGAPPRLVSSFHGNGLVRLRYALFTAKRAHATLVLLTGFNETFLYYAKTISDLLQKGFNVATMDHRGQGLSDREAAVRDTVHVAHVHSFDDYVRDAVYFIREVVCRDAAWHCKRVTVIGHSMGGHLALRLAAQHADVVRSTVALSPMLWIRTPLRLPHACMEILAGGVCYGGYATRGFWTRRHHLSALHHTIDTANPKWNTITHSPASLRAIDRVRLLLPFVFVSPSYRWVYETCCAIRRMWRVHRTTLAASGAPVLMLTSGDDRYVDSDAARVFAEACPNVACVEIPGAFHNLLLESTFARSTALEYLTGFALNAHRHTCTISGTTALAHSRSSWKQCRLFPALLALLGTIVVTLTTANVCIFNVTERDS